MNDISVNDNGMKDTLDVSSPARSTIADVQHWNYEWEKAYLELNDNNDQQTKTATNAQGTSSDDLHATITSATSLTRENVEGRLAKTPESNIAWPTGVAGKDNLVHVSTSLGLPSQGSRPVAHVYNTLFQPNSTAPQAGINTNGLQNFNFSEQLASPQWQIESMVQPAKMGLIVYKTADNQFKVWLRDKTIMKHQGAKLIKELRGMFSTLGSTLAVVTLNGEEIFNNNSQLNSNINDEVAI